MQRVDALAGSSVLRQCLYRLAAGQVACWAIGTPREGRQTWTLPSRDLVT